MVPGSKPPISPRKTPKQERSRSLIEAVLDATTRVLTTLGYESATTNRVAELAGVSIGSLYQYFPNKDAIMASLISRQFALHKDSIARMLAESADRPAGEAIEKVIGEVVDMFLNKKALLKSLFIHLPRLEKTRELLLTRNDIVELLSDFLRSRPEMDPSRDVRATLIVLSNAVMGVIQTAVISDEMMLPRETMKAELAKLARSYLLA